MKSKETNYHFSFTVEVNNTQEKVWQTLIDVPTWAQWDTELKEASLEGDFVAGAKGVLIPKKGPKLPFFIAEFSPNQTYTFNTKMPLGWLIIKRTLTAKNGMTYFTDDIAFTGILKRIFGFMLGSQFRSVLPEVMQNFKKLAEEK
jgi:Polyketide cyclase / dehydrase and lipid transport